MRFLIQKLFWASDDGFKLASCVAPQTRQYLHSVQIWRVIRWPLFLFKHLGTISWMALLRDTCNARRAPCIFLNLPFRLAAVGCSLQWTLGAEINKQLQLLFATTLTLTTTYVTVTSLSCKAGIKFGWNKWELVKSKLNSQKSSGIHSIFLVISLSDV